MLRLWLLALTVVAALLSPVAMADPLDELRAGTSAYKEGKYQEAVDAFTRAIISGQLSVEALAVTFNNRGVAYGELGDFDRAILDYTEALGLRPGDATATRNLRVGHVRRGVMRAQQGDVDAAIADFTRAIELDPNHFLAYLRRGEARLGQGQVDAALSDLERAEALASDNAQVREVLARARSVKDAEPATAQATGNGRDEPPASPDPGTTAESAAPSQPVTPEGGSPGSEASGAPEQGSVGTARPTSTGAVPDVTAPDEQGPESEPVAPPPPTPTTDMPPGDVPESAGTVPQPAPEATPSAPESPAALPADARRVRTRQGVNVRAGPGNSFERLMTVPGGAEASVIEERRGWQHLRFANGSEGWVYETWLEPAGP
jgi:Flp pilus assembly protein TadD